MLCSLTPVFLPDGENSRHGGNGVDIRVFVIAPSTTECGDQSADGGREYQRLRLAQTYAVRMHIQGAFLVRSGEKSDTFVGEHGWTLLRTGLSKHERCCHTLLGRS